MSRRPSLIGLLWACPRETRNLGSVYLHCCRLHRQMASSISDGQRARKRQKFTHDSSAHHPLPTTLGATASLPNSSAAMSVADSPAKSALKGRRRYNADIEDMIHACEKGFECATLKITGALREHIPHYLRRPPIIGTARSRLPTR